MTTYYKATSPDGLSFREGPGGRIDYASALASGEVIRHPAKKWVRNDASTYISVSVAAADCTGAQWPCRLFRVEPVGGVMGSDDYPNKRAVSALRVVEELPAYLALGPNGEQVAAFIEGCKTLSPDDWRNVAAARAAAGAAAWDAARAAAWAAARAAAGAIVVRDLITPDQYDILTQPFVDAGFAGMVGR
jgi:hypothetical protein